MITINAQTIINEAMAALAVAPDKTGSDFFDKIKFQTSARGFHSVQNSKENLQRFADMVRKNAAAFGGGLIRETKPRPAVSWPANLISLFKQSIEDNDYQAALDIGDKLGALFFVTNKGQALMQVAPVPCDFEPRLSSVCNEDGTFAVIFPQNMTSLSGSSYKAKRSRQAQIDNVQTALNARTNFNLSEALDKQSYSPVDQAATRAQWIAEHGLSAETIETRIETHEAEAIEALAAQDVAQVVAQAVAAVAISEAMQPAESAELVTCEAGESEASSVTVGSASGATWAPVPQYVPCPPNKTSLGDGPAPAFRGTDSDTPTPPVAEFLGEHTPPVAGFLETPPNCADDISLSLAVSAYSGISMSPERRGQYAKSEYAQTMAADYETMRAQAVKGGTLDLLPEVFARYRARQASAYKAYLSSSSRCVSSFIAGPSNFPAARMNKRSDIAHKRLGEYLNGGESALRAACRTLRPDLRAIMSGDQDAVERLTADISKAERNQEHMKEANKAIRANAKKGEAHQVAALMELGYSEIDAMDLLNPRFSRGQGFPAFSLTNNQANIRRMRERLEKISAAKACEVVAVECSNGVTLEDDAPANRVRLFFPGKPPEAIRDELKSSGFRWAPSVGAWQAYRNHGTLATARRMAGDPLPAAPEVAEVEQVEATPTVAVSTEAPTPAPVEFLGDAIPTVTEFLPTSPVYQLPEKQDDWNGAKYSADFVPNARQQIVIDAVQTALNEGKYYTSDVLARCIELLNIDAHTASMNFGMRVEGGIVGMDCYYARGYIEAKNARESSLKTFNEMALREGDELGILVFTDYKRTTGVKITGVSEGGSTFTFTGKRGAYTVTGTGSADQLKCAIDRAFSTGKRKTDYTAFLAAQAKRQAPTPPAVESQPMAPVVETPETLDVESEPVKSGVHPEVADSIARHGIAAYGPLAQAEILAKLADAPTPAAPTLQSEWLAATQTNRIEGKSGKWLAWFWMTSAGVIALGFSAHGQTVNLTAYATASDRMKALQALARAADAPTDTPQGGGLPCPEPVAVVEPVASVAPTPTVAVSSDKPKHPRQLVPANGKHIVEDAFEAWTYHYDISGKFGFVMYLGKQYKPYAYYGYATEAERDDGFQRHAHEAREILASKAKRKAEVKTRIDAGHGLQVGDVVRSSWGYDQTNIDHYQIVKVIGKRTVEVRRLAEHEEATGYMTGRVSPIWGEFVGDVMRRQVDQWGNVNILSASYGRADKIEPIATVHGVRCYAASGYSSYA